MDSSRRKDIKRSSLENINGVGPAKAKAILKQFKSLTAVKNASIDDLEKVSGINKDIALNIYNYFHGNKK